MIAQHLAALIWRDEPRPLSRIEIVIVLGVHVAGLAAVWRYFQQPIWFALPLLAILLALPLVDSIRTRRALAVETLAPLFFLYAILSARVITIWFIRAPLPYQDESTLANFRLLVFQIELAVLATLVYIFLIQVTRFTRHATRITMVIAVGLGAVSLAWFAVETIGHRTQGVTGTDPYAYTQMAIDLATRGTFLHEFPIFAEIQNLGIKWYPVEHVGYRLFDNMSGSAVTVWPFGGSVWLALAYGFFGEPGLYLATPLAGLISLLVFGAFAWSYFSERTRLESAMITAIAVALLATSWEQVDRSLVPLVDVQAQLFSTLAILFAVMSVRSKRVMLIGALTGVALGLAYLVRHTQVLLVVPIVIAAFPLSARNRARFLFAAGFASLVIALPDLIYHQQNFGSWLTPESNELALFSLNGISGSAQTIADRFFAGNEFGYLVPFLAYGIYRAARENASEFAVLAIWLVVLVGFHLFYPALRMRDLLPEFPVIVLLTGFGVVALANDLRVSRWAVSRLLSAVVIFLALLLFLSRSQFTLWRVVQPAKITFGYVTSAQRASFDQIAALTPANAVIGSTMNDGAIDLYAHRLTFRPGEWNTEERIKFVDTMLNNGRRVFLLDDGAETSVARRDWATRYKLNKLVVFDVPLASVVDGAPGAFYEITN